MVVSLGNCEITEMASAIFNITVVLIIIYVAEIITINSQENLFFWCSAELQLPRQRSKLSLTFATSETRSSVLHVHAVY